MVWPRGSAADSCPEAVQIPAFLQGELSAAEHARIGEHVEFCFDCQNERIEFAMLLHRLEEMDSLDAPLLGGRPLLTLDHLRRPRTRAESALGLVAACVLLLLLGRGPSPSPATESAPKTTEVVAVTPPRASTLLAIQNEDGSWTPETPGGNSTVITTTALCLSALGAEDFGRREHQLSIDDGTRFLLRNQDANGRIGSTLESHLVALWALKQIRASSGWNGMDPAIALAEAYLEDGRTSSHDPRRNELARRLSNPREALPAQDAIIACLISAPVAPRRATPRDPLRLAALCLSL